MKYGIFLFLHLHRFILSFVHFQAAISRMFTNPRHIPNSSPAPFNCPNRPLPSCYFSYIHSSTAYFYFFTSAHCQAAISRIFTQLWHISISSPASWFTLSYALVAAKTTYTYIYILIFFSLMFILNHELTPPLTPLLSRLL